MPLSPRVDALLNHPGVLFDQLLLVPCGPFIDHTNTSILRTDQFDTKMSVFVENENTLQS